MTNPPPCRMVDPDRHSFTASRASRYSYPTPSTLFPARSLSKESSGIHFSKIFNTFIRQELKVVNFHIFFQCTMKPINIQGRDRVI